MADIDGFDRFPLLPAELRIKIWKYAMPKRILQLGIDFPFPFLPPADLKDDTLWPVPYSVPILFSICHESRSLCLSQYLPFAYGYIHTSLDTLYISRKAGARLFVNAFRASGIDRAPLYPMSMLERVLIEFEFCDLPPRPSRPSASSSVLNAYCHVMEMFGPPKQLLLVEGLPWNTPSHPEDLAGWENIEILEVVEEPVVSGDQLTTLEFVQRTLNNDAKYNPWIAWRTPDVAFAKVKREGRFNRHCKGMVTDSIVNAMVTTAARWRQDELAVKHRVWDWAEDGNPYSLEHMESVLAKYKQTAV